MLDISKTLLIFLIVLLCSLSSPVDSPLMAEPTEAGASKNTAELIWGKEVDNRHVLFYSFLENGSWHKPLLLSHPDKNSLVPTLAADYDGRTYAAWSVLNGEKSYLEFAVLQNGRIQRKPERIETGMAANLGAFLGIDNNGVTWLVWSGNNGSPSDVFYSSFRDGRWLPPQRVHPANAVPDILPELEISPGGEVIVHWKSITPDGKPAILTKILNKEGVTSPPVLQRPARDADPFAGTNDCITDFPAEADDFDKGVLLSRCGKESSPVQTRFFGRSLRRQNREMH